MLDFSDQPYQYFPPRYHALAAWAIRLVNRWRHLPHALRFDGVSVTAHDALRPAVRQRRRLMLVPNHPTHADAAILLEATRQLGIVPQAMAAYDVFLRGKLDQWVMQRLGTFSVDREGSDNRAMKQAAATLQEGRFALAIFPEGNVYLTNDVVTPFHEGAAFLALRAVKDWPAEQDLLATPVSIKATYCQDVRPQLLERLRDLARAIDCPLQDSDPPAVMIRSVGLAALRRNLKHRGIAVAEGDDLPTLIATAGGAVIARVGAKLGMKPPEDQTLIERIRAVRRRIHDVRIDPACAADHAAAVSWADEAMLAFRIASYSGAYVSSNPTIDRCAETIEKLCEDCYSRCMPPLGPRQALVHFGEPLAVRPYLQRGKLREAVRLLTSDLEEAVQRGVDGLHRRNTHIGGQLWER